MTNIHIVGAGMAGLLAAALLRDEAVAVYERQPSLPNNHNAVLRFRSQIVAHSLNMEFKEVTVIKEMGYASTEIGKLLGYARKATGTYQLRSASAGVVTRYIAPPDFIARMAAKVMAPIKYNHDFWALAQGGPAPIVSTMPMPDLMDHLQYPGERPDFRSVPGLTITTQLQSCDAYCTMYVPDFAEQFYRVSITGSELIIEMAFPREMGWAIEAAQNLAQQYAEFPSRVDEIISKALGVLGCYIPYDEASTKVRVARYQKIAPVDNDKRKRFILWATEAHKVFSLGRFATWRPGVMLDDLVNDVRIIQKLIGGGVAYGV